MAKSNKISMLINFVLIIALLVIVSMVESCGIGSKFSNQELKHEEL